MESTRKLSDAESAAADASRGLLKVVDSPAGNCAESLNYAHVIFTALHVWPVA